MAEADGAAVSLHSHLCREQAQYEKSEESVNEVKSRVAPTIKLVRSATPRAAKEEAKDEV